MFYLYLLLWIISILLTFGAGRIYETKVIIKSGWLRSGSDLSGVYHVIPDKKYQPLPKDYEKDKLLDLGLFYDRLWRWATLTQGSIGNFIGFYRDMLDPNLASLFHEANRKLSDIKQYTRSLKER